MFNRSFLQRIKKLEKKMTVSECSACLSSGHRSSGGGEFLFFFPFMTNDAGPIL